MNIPDKKYIHSITLSQCSRTIISERLITGRSARRVMYANTGCTVHDAYVRNRVSWTCIQSPWLKVNLFSESKSIQ